MRDSVTLKRALTVQDRLDGKIGAYESMEVSAYIAESFSDEFMAQGWVAEHIERLKHDSNSHNTP